MTLLLLVDDCFFSLDSTLAVDWGSEEQTLKSTFLNDGVTTQDYEWRKYGLIVTIERDGKRTRMQYTFRDKASGVSLLQGSAIGGERDTIRMQGTYTVKRTYTRGIPILSALPIVGYLFGRKKRLRNSVLLNFTLFPSRTSTSDSNSNVIPTGTPRKQNGKLARCSPRGAVLAYTLSFPAL